MTTAQPTAQQRDEDVLALCAAWRDLAVARGRFIAAKTDEAMFDAGRDAHAARMRLIQLGVDERDL